MNDVDNRGPAVVVSGTVIGGFEFHGPFPTISAAHEWYEQQFFGGFLKMPASIVLLAAPRPATTDLDAAPAATASEAENQAVGRRAETSAGEAGTGDTRASDSAIVEAAAEVAYAAMLFDRKSINGRPGAPLVPPPPWVPRGNSLAQDAARDAARKILAMKPPAAGLTLTDMERWSVEEGRDALRGLGREIYADQLAGLLARAAKEATR